ncbi:MAG: hypothetical protein PF488_03885 [Patescibacteria group bacterium]|jgi:hypothetical protein|nr:hypothetical protein [Patescibacteria group bacterium]
MFKPIKTVVLIIAFIVLAAIASVAFSNSEEGNEEKGRVNNITKEVLNFVSAGTKSIANLSFIKNNQDIKETEDLETNEESNLENDSNFSFSKIKGDFLEKMEGININEIKKQWQEKMGIGEKKVEINYDSDDLKNQQDKLEDFLSNIEKNN